MAFLCGTIYVGASFDAAVVDAPTHVALLIWFSEFGSSIILSARDLFGVFLGC